ncbi:CocE/NonD family hydrolase [Pseudonocardia xishanensis]|uniref:CocE/NonD family hydrolase n=1 Tax=Pseudonocardia xishanensis TaxID=630995 RepID=A0ABP8RHQ7_9PSEU
MNLETLRGPHEVTREPDVVMRTRDGKSLLTDVYRPVGVDRAPTLLRRTPYGKQANDLAEDFSEAHYYASHGYLTVVQNTRGRFGSEGAWYPFVYEARDGYDAIEWAAGLPGSNGRVGTFGQSYGALSQYLAATQRPPHLVTCIPVSAYLGAYENYWYNQGALELSWTLSYFMNMAQDVLAEAGDVERLAELEKLKADPEMRFSPLTDDALRHLPIRDWVERFGQGAPFLADILHHEKDGPYWWTVDLRRQLQNIDVPMLHVGSWYDIANRDTPQYFTGLQAAAMSAGARESQALFMGPWSHLLPYSRPTSGGTGDIDFGPEAAYPVLQMQKAWFDHFVRDGREGLPQAPVRLFVMGENRWRDEAEWPLARTRTTRMYLHDNGSLAAETPGDETADVYVYDPDDPVPTAGGRYVGGGVRDQRANQARADVLVYTAPPVDDVLEITGPLSLRLFVATDAPDTDFVAVVSDVHPDGFVHNLAEGLVRMRYRDGYDEPSLLEPGSVHEVEIELGNIGHAVLPGHALRLHVTSSDFPRWDRNPNTGEPSVRATTTRKATQTVHHDRSRPSALSLPVIPRA